MNNTNPAGPVRSMPPAQNSFRHTKKLPATPILIALAIICAAATTIAILSVTTAYFPPNIQWIAGSIAGVALLAICIVACYQKNTSHSAKHQPPKPKSRKTSNFENILPRPLPDTQIPTYDQQNIKLTLHQYAKDMHFSLTEQFPHDRDINALNKACFAFVKKQLPESQTPLDYFWTLLGYSIDAPLAIGTDNILHLRENQFYTKRYDGAFVREDISTRVFGWRIKKSRANLDIYMDGISQGAGLLINQSIYYTINGRGKTSPSYRLKPGDVVLQKLGEGAIYLFTVGEDGSLILPPRQRHLLPRTEQAEIQSKRFEQHTGEDVFFTTNNYAAEIGFVPLEQGFSVHSKLSLKQTEDYSSGDLVYLDMEKDIVLQKLVSYLKEEFKLMQYTDEEKIFRLTVLVSDLLSQEMWGYKMQNNYLLGEILRSGSGVCRHRSFLLKVLADSLGLKCALIKSAVSTAVPFWGLDDTVIGYMEMPDSAAHAWNVIQIKDGYWIVDPMHRRIFPVNNPPGDTQEKQDQILKWYGIPGSMIDPKK